MKNRNKTILAICAGALVCALLAGCNAISPKADEAPAVPEATQAPSSLDVSNQGITDANLAEYAAQKQLKTLDLRGNTLSAEAVTALKTSLPECEIIWSIPIGGEQFDSNVDTVVLPQATTAEELEYLDCFTALQSVDATKCTCYDALAAKAAKMPEVAFTWQVDVCGVSVQNTETSIDLTAAQIDENALVQAVQYLPNLESVDLTGQTLSEATMDALSAACPQTTFLWSFDLYGVTVSSDMTEVDLSGKELTELDTLKKKLAYLPNLTKVDMCNCGTTNEQMEELTAAFPQIKFVWMIQVGGWEMRTDVKAFSKGNRHSFEGGSFVGGRTDLRNEDIQPLKYCTELVALDLGHSRKITDISIIRNMPKLRFLIVAMEGITDISDLTYCPELEYVETFQNYVADLSPLLSLKKLTHLNCSTNIPAEKDQKDAAAAANLEVLKQMTQLERLWCIRDGFTDEQIAALQTALPNCVINTTGTHSTSNGWRDSDLYREMQKLFSLPALE